MSESLTDLLVTDAELDSIACRQVDDSRDSALTELARLAGAVDAPPLRPVVTPHLRPGLRGARKGSWALAVTVALMATSSGVAAAVSESPLAPLHYVTRQVWKVGPHPGDAMPGWHLDGSMPISTVPGVDRSDARRDGSAGSASDGVSAAPTDGVVNTGSAPSHAGSVRSDAGTAPGDAGTAQGDLAGSGAATERAGRPGRSASFSSQVPSDAGSSPRPRPGAGMESEPSSGHGTHSGGGSASGAGQDQGSAAEMSGAGAGPVSGPWKPTAPQGSVASGDPALGEWPYPPRLDRVPSTGTGTAARHCRIGTPPIAVESTWGGHEALRPCEPQPPAPIQPVAPSGPTLAPTLVPPTPGAKPEQSGTAASIR
jgi:hypothetical protein